MFFSTSSSSSASRMSITTEDIRNYKIALLNMKGTKVNATAMLLITDETIYRLTIDVATKAIAALKKVIRRGQCHYRPGSKTDRLVKDYQKVLREYQEMTVKMKMKMVPSKADFLIDCWLKKDAAQKAAEECRKRKAQRKAARKEREAKMDVAKPVLKVTFAEPIVEIPDDIRIRTEIIV
uniref:DDE-1 domain-containing protein n=1 Tax=Caenorhabditis tropicalis TaxID=1561998 RepID=A0A1I7URY1_9PELO